jgi:uncharacterized membrane protein
MRPEKVKCEVSGNTLPRYEAMRITSLSPSLLRDLREKHPSLNEKGYISLTEFHLLQTERLKRLFKKDRGELSHLEKEVMEGIGKEGWKTRNTEEALLGPPTFGDRLADRIAEFGGSWKFIILFGVFIAGWTLLNLYILRGPFDPYPFILLNLILSCVAALQAPVIMMSQNRMEAKDRLRAQNDYQVNLRAEIEIRQLHDKMDHLMMKQMDHLLEIQEIQVEMLNELAERDKRDNKK